MIGRGFVFLMIVMALSAVFIRQLNNDNFSWVHVFVPITPLGAWQVVTKIRRYDIKGHTNAVKGMFFGVLLIPAVLSLLPGRLLYGAFFG